MSLYDLLIPAYAQMLRALAAQLSKAEAGGFEMTTLLAGRLAPDMFPLSEQIRFVCIQAIGAVHRLTREEDPGPALASSELADLRAHLAETIAFVEGASADEINAAAERPIELALPNGLTFDLPGFAYIRDWSQPQFYFHLMAAYAIMRHLGVDLGKRDYVPYMMKYLRPAS